MSLVNSDKVLLKVILIIFIVASLGANGFLGYQYFMLQKELKMTKANLEAQKINEKLLDFADFFIAKVLKAETEVDFETRLKLETMVRDLRDEQILSQWQKFIDSKTEEEAQKEVKNLLEMMVKKIIAR